MAGENTIRAGNVEPEDEQEDEEIGSIKEDLRNLGQVHREN